MKKVLAGLFVFMVLAVIAVFVFIPAQLNISSAIMMKANTNSLFRNLADESKWIKWWPAESEERQSVKDSGFLKFNKFNYRLTKKLYHAVEVETINTKQAVNGKIFIIPLAEDSLIVQWQNSFATSSNPVTRLSQYLHAIDIKKNMTVLLNRLKSFSENKDKVYNLHIYHATLEDTFYISLKTILKSYPSTKEIYKSIDSLRRYIAESKVNAVDFPMLNITKKDSLHYEVMVALPADKIISGNERILTKRMIAYPNKILTADVTGGPEEIKAAYETINTYLKDYNLTTPVISWETLITDRSKGTDSTKWITRICVPIA